MKKYIFLFIIFFVIGSEALSAQEEPVVYGDHGRRDPFWPLISSSGAVLVYDANLDIADVVLEGIIYDPNGEQFALINSKVVKSSETIGGFFVVLIEEDRVVLRKDGQEFILRSKKEK